MTDNDRAAKIKALEEQLNALRAEDEAEKVARRQTALQTLIDQIDAGRRAFNFTDEELGFKGHTAKFVAKSKAAAKSTASEGNGKKVKPVYFNPQAPDDKKICRGAGTVPDWYKNATAEQKEVFEVTDHNKAYELIKQYGKAKDAKAYYVCYIEPNHPNPEAA